MAVRVIGYGICGPGEASRYLRETLEDFKRLCDEVIILVNAPHSDDVFEEIDLIHSYGFTTIYDSREWGKKQWRIKQDFVSNYVSQAAKQGDMMLCLDMDETMPDLTREWLLSAEFDAYKVFIVDLWNDPQHYKSESCFWNTRIWRWNGDTQWINKPVHCGLAPRWAVAYNRHAPFLLLHKGLMLKEDRARKIARYEKYDPDAAHLDKRFYKMLSDDRAELLNLPDLRAKLEEEVKAYKQTKPRNSPMDKPKERFAYVENPAGFQVDIPEKHLHETLKRKGFKFIGWADEAQAELEALFPDEPIAPGNFPAGSYQRPMADEKAEVDALNANDIDPTGTGHMPSTASPRVDPNATSLVQELPPHTPIVPPVIVPSNPDEPIVRNRLGVEHAPRPVTRAATKTATKAAAKQTNAK